MLALRSGCNLISGLWCRLDQPAGPDGIRRGMPHLLHVLEGLGSVQVYFPAVRPVLPSSAHLPAQPFSDPTLFFWFVDLPRGGREWATLLLIGGRRPMCMQYGTINSCCSCGPGRIPFLVDPVMDQECPDYTCHLVGQSHHRYVQRPAGQQLFQPRLPLLGASNHHAGTMDQ